MLFPIMLFVSSFPHRQHACPLMNFLDLHRWSEQPTRRSLINNKSQLSTAPRGESWESRGFPERLLCFAIPPPKDVGENTVGFFFGSKSLESVHASMVSTWMLFAVCSFGISPFALQTVLSLLKEFLDPALVHPAVTPRCLQESHSFVRTTFIWVWRPFEV